jgi:hypothetical protein
MPLEKMKTEIDWKQLAIDVESIRDGRERYKNKDSH